MEAIIYTVPQHRTDFIAGGQRIWYIGQTGKCVIHAAAAAGVLTASGRRRWYTLAEDIICIIPRGMRREALESGWQFRTGRMVRFWINGMNHSLTSAMQRLTPMS